MLFVYEIKKILKRITPLILLVLLAAVAATTIIITAIAFNQSPAAPVDHDADYVALQTKINQWNQPQQEQIAIAFDNFYTKYKAMNAATYGTESLVTAYNDTRNAFQNFYTTYYTPYLNTDRVADYLLVRSSEVKRLSTLMTNLNGFLTGAKTDTQIRQGLSINSQWEINDVLTVFDHINVQTMAPEDLQTLQEFFSTHVFSPAAYQYARDTFLLSIATNSTYQGSLAAYDGFADYQDQPTAVNNIKLAEYQLAHPDQDFAQPLTFGDIYNNAQQVSMTDFTFTNLEMAMIPLLILIIIFAACAFFTDNYRGTVITTIAATKKRSTVIIAKTLAVIVLSLIAVLSLTTVYLICSALFFHACLTPNILFLFNGTTAMTMSTINYFFLYLLSLMCKILPLIAVCGLFSYSKADPRLIVALSFVVVLVVWLCNALLGHFWFYQFVPFLALDPIRYFGATLLLSPTPSAINIWYTWPAMALITVYLYGQLIYNFQHKDF